MKSQYKTLKSAPFLALSPFWVKTYFNIWCLLAWKLAFFKMKIPLGETFQRIDLQWGKLNSLWKKMALQFVQFLTWYKKENQSQL